MLEKRLTQRIFKGFSTVKALWRMSSVNMRPRLRVNDRVPEHMPLTDLKGNAAKLRNLMRRSPARPQLWLVQLTAIPVAAPSVCRVAGRAA